LIIFFLTVGAAIVAMELGMILAPNGLVDVVKSGGAIEGIEMLAIWFNRHY
jgi:uncharacterized membrane-anchored protein YitT (DUF2179 family)